MFDQPKYLCLDCWRITKADNLFCEVNTSNNPDPEAEGKRRLGELYSLSLIERMSESKPNLYERARQDNQTVVCECGKEILPSTKLCGDQPPAIRIAGTKSSGKTLFIATIELSLRKFSNVVTLWGIGNAAQRLNTILEELQNGQRPEPTPENSTERYAWEIVEDGKAGDQCHPLLVIHDIAGETWEKLNERCPEDLSRYLALPGHLILVLDGATIADDLGLVATDAWDPEPRRGDGGVMDSTILGYIRDHLGKDRLYKKIKLALVITKADLLWDDFPVLKEVCKSLSKTEAKQEDLKNLLRDSKRGNLVTIAENRFKDSCIFATSSLGFRPKNEGATVQPLGTILPLLWLLEHYE